MKRINIGFVYTAVSFPGHRKSIIIIRVRLFFYFNKISKSKIMSTLVYHVRHRLTEKKKTIPLKLLYQNITFHRASLQRIKYQHSENQISKN